MWQMSWSVEGGFSGIAGATLVSGGILSAGRIGVDICFSLALSEIGLRRLARLGWWWLGLTIPLLRIGGCRRRVFPGL